MPLPVRTGAEPMQMMDDDCLTAAAIKEQNAILLQILECQKQMCEMHKQEMAKEDKPEKKKKKTGTIKRDASGAISGIVIEEDC